MQLSYEDFNKAKEILQIKDFSTFKDIKENYHQQIQKHHPDKNPRNNESHKKTIELMQAYETLAKYCQNYLFDLTKDQFLQQTTNKSYEENSFEYQNWWKDNYGNQELF